MAKHSLPYVLLPRIKHGFNDNADDDDDDDGTPSIQVRRIITLGEKNRTNYGVMSMFMDLDAWCIGSSHGWLILLDTNTEPLLLEPSSVLKIRLPPLPPALYHPVLPSYFAEFLRKSFVVKAVLTMSSANPLNHILAIIYGIHCKIAYCKSAEWFEIPDAKDSYCDIVFSNDNLYALAGDGSIEGWNLCQQHGTPPRKILYVAPTMEIDCEEERRFCCDKYSRQLYLVMCERGTLMVVRYIGNFVNGDGVVVEEEDLLSLENSHPLICPYRTKHFGVYKLDLGEAKWKKMRSLGDQALFLGINESTSMLAQGFEGYEANSIYFTDDRWSEMNLDYLYGGHDWGVFNLEDQSVELLTPYANRIDPPPVWVLPTSH